VIQDEPKPWGEDPATDPVAEHTAALEHEIKLLRQAVVMLMGECTSIRLGPMLVPAAAVKISEVGEKIVITRAT